MCSGVTTIAPRACGYRCRVSRRAASRIAWAASRAGGYLGMVEGLQPPEPISGSAHELPYSLPRSLDEALGRLRACEPLLQILGEPFVAAYTIVKQAEHEVFLQVISSWEREHLLLNV